MKKILILLGGAAILALAGCSSADEKPRKGKYKPEIELTEINIPGMTDAMKEQAKTSMQTSFAASAGTEQCLRGGNKGDWKEAASGLSKSMGGTCETTKDNSTEDTADIEVTCKGTQMGDVQVKMTGAAQSESFSMDVDFKFKHPQMGEGNMGMKMGAKRVGDC